MQARDRICVQYGAGLSGPARWLNFDASPTLRVQRLPVVGRLIARLAGGSSPFPGSVVYGDIVKGLKVAPGTVECLYASHVLEHLTREDMRQALRHSFEMLMSNGIFRLIVPDLLERARRYVSAAEQGDAQAAHRFMESTCLGVGARSRGALAGMRAAFGNSAHLWMWDFPSMQAELQKVGFVDIRRAAIGDSGEAMFDLVEDEDRFIDDGVREVAIQARKP